MNACSVPEQHRSVKMHGARMDGCSGTVADNVSLILEDIRSAALRSGRRAELIRLVAVTKGV
ncbi:MAG TPA: hypothetical protein VFG71_12570, partial [Nitrospiraceae bacterium]|nr:hypothetical protein [Nitrospiraceae bacterium]